MPSDVIVIHVAGVPRPLPRPRFVNGRAVSIVDKRARAWARAIEAECRKAPRMAWSSAACRVRCSFYFPTSKAERWGQPHTARPDTDNLLKLVMDAAERGGVLAKGDARAASVVAEKLWARAGGAVIEFRPWRAESDAMAGSSGQEKAPRAG